MKIRWDSQRCYGCRACELACSFHHHQAFSPGGGSIRVFRNHGTGELRWIQGKTCDLCPGEAQPLCVRYCSYQALETGEEQVENR